MVSKRQREARKRFKAANPNLFPKPDPSAGTNDSSSVKRKKYKKALLKKWRSKPSEGDAAEGRKRSSSTLRKHPLRVPGMKPGESCFICKSKDHIAKHCHKKAEWEKNKICLLCRKRGHSLKNCPEKNDNDDNKYCYNCGQNGHSLDKCPQPLQDGGTRYASCFICKEQGHLSKNCPKNMHGIYPKGGSCKNCDAVTHLVKDCPNKGSKDAVSSGNDNTISDGREIWQGKLTVFLGGDDLEDDFSFDTQNGGKKKKTKHSDPSSNLQTEGTIPSETKKRRSGPKIVNFVG